MGRETFGRRVRQLREDLGWTQSELRDEVKRKAGVTMGASYLSQLERAKEGGKLPSLEIARGLAIALGCSLDYLALLSDSPSLTDQDIGNSFLSEEAETVAAVTDSLSPSGRHMIYQVARIQADVEREGIAARMEEFKALLNMVESLAGPEVRRRIEAEVRRAGTSSVRRPDLLGKATQLH